MPTDRLLITLLRALQTRSEQQDTPRILSTAVALLTTLSNPLNLTLVTSQLLLSPALWTQPDGLQSCLRFMSVFQSSAMRILQHEDQVREAKQLRRPIQQPPNTPLIGGDLSRDEWVKAIVKGADDRTPPWRHILVIAGLLIGFEAQDREGLPKKLRKTLEHALVQAVNLSLDDVGVANEIGVHCVALVLNYSFELLSDLERAQIRYDRLLPVLVGTAFFSGEGYASAQYLGAIDADVVQTTDGKLAWPEHSASYRQVLDMASRPLVSSMGPLSRLIAHTIENVSEAWLVQTAMDDLSNFANILDNQWRHNKLSAIEEMEERNSIEPLTLDKTLPTLWRIFRSSLFALAIVLRAVLGRILNDRPLASAAISPTLAIQSLHILRNLYFITVRLGGTASFSQYTFVNLAAIDILTAYPAQSTDFITSIAPRQLTTIPPHPHDRNHALFFLNTAEHFTLTLSPATNDTVLLAAASPYLSTGADPRLLPAFEAAHSLTLAVLAAPQNTTLAAAHLPFYADALLQVFPHAITPRQFRLAVRTLLRIASPPNALASSHPDLAETLLELLRARAHLPSPPGGPAHPIRPGDSDPPTDPQATLVLALIDCLPVLAPHLLVDWLGLVADLLPHLPDGPGRVACRQRFWEVLAGGEMDAERAALCVAWWGTRGGREAVMGGSDEFMMSGALGGRL